MQKAYVANKGILVNNQGRILVMRDSGQGDHANSKGRWHFPGGRMDAGEKPLHGLVREIREETGIEIEPKQARLFFVDKWGVGGDVVNEPIIGMFYIVEIGNGQVKISGEHEEIEWIDPRQPIAEEFKNLERVIEAYRSREGIVVGADEAIKGREGLGLIQVLTGNGKGKTTSSLGLAIRAIGAGLKVGIVYFDKGGTEHYSERKILDEFFEGHIDYVATGRDRIDPETGKFDFTITDLDREEAERGLDEARRMFHNDYDLVILDEINSTAHLGMVEKRDVLELIEGKPDKLEVVMTGRNAPESFIKKAHLVTSMRLKKHYFYSGVPAREGIDF